MTATNAAWLKAAEDEGVAGYVPCPQCGMHWCEKFEDECSLCKFYNNRGEEDVLAETK